MKEFYSLHNHTEYSNIRLIDCINKIPMLIDRAVKLGMKGIAITDHETVSGHIQAMKYVRDRKKKGKIPKDFKLILGNEIYLINGTADSIRENYKPGDGKLFYHYILLAKDEIGHEQLRRLSSNAWDKSFNIGKMTRVPTEKGDLARIVRENPGHLIASTACLGGELPILIMQMEEAMSENELYEAKCKIDDFIRWNVSLFGDDFFLEMQPGASEEQKVVNKWLLKLSKAYDLNYIVTTDSHYLSSKSRMIHKAYLQSKEEEREVDSFYQTTYLMEIQEMYDYMEYFDEEIVTKAIENTAIIGNKIEEYSLSCSTIVPAAEVPEFEVENYFEKYYERFTVLKEYANSSNIYDKYLLYLIEKGYQKKEIHAKVCRNDFTEEQKVERIAIELQEMALVTEKIKSSISSYYISTLELINIMWDEGDSLVGVARGSVTGMYTMYLIDLIQMNPLDWGLPHWRHISHEKAELSDVDIDSQKNRREQIISAVKDRKGERKVLNCCTFKTEGSKSAILTSCRALGIDPDTSSYLAGMVPVTRGATWSLHDCIYGNEEKEREAVPGFEKEMRSHDQLLDIAMGIEGLISGRSIHASAVYVFNEDFIKHNARMKAPNGVLTTQFNMADSDECGGLKMDFLTIEALDKIRLTMEQLIEAGYMKWQGSLRETYDKYLHPDVLDYETREMWDWVAENKVVDLFQFNTQTGLQAARRIQPHSLEELAAANSIMRLMVTEEGAEQPIDTYIRFKNDIGQWYDLMRTEYHLTDHEIEILEKYLKSNYGVGDTQEIVMEISMDKEIADFSVADSNKLRKSISKKKPALQQAMKEQFFERGKENHASDNLLNYVWKEVVGKQLGYSFSKNHTYPYSAIGLQELNLAYHYPIIYWNTACLTVNAGADEESKGSKQSTGYGKVATSIAQMQKRGIKIQAPLINKAELGFKADEENNAILFALKSISGIGDDVVEIIREVRPFSSFDDFYERMVETKIVKTNQVIQLIKAGSFDEFNTDRVGLLYKIVQLCKCKPVSSLTKSQLNRMQELHFMYPEMNLIPEDITKCIQVYNFSQYVKDLKVVKKYVDPSKKRVPKCGYHDEIIELDDRAMKFFMENYTEDSIYDVKDEHYLICRKKFNKETEAKIESLRDYLSKEKAVNLYNRALVVNEAENVVTGTLSHMEMESLCVYVHPHELDGLNTEEYNVVDFFSLPEEPVVASTYKRKVKRVKDGQKIEEIKEFPKYYISKIWGTVIDKNKDRHTVTLLTPEGVVNVKYSKGAFLHYNKKTSIEESWFKRGQMIMVTGYRNGDMFRCYNYGDTIFKHTTSLITNIDEKGVHVMTERMREE